jgi:hypothetical protein
MKPAGWVVVHAALAGSSGSIPGQQPDPKQLRELSVAKGATILDNELDDAGNFVVLREGI